MGIIYLGLIFASSKCQALWLEVLLFVWKRIMKKCVLEKCIIFRWKITNVTAIRKSEFICLTCNVDPIYNILHASNKLLRGVRIPPWFSWVLRSCRMLDNVCRSWFTDVSERISFPTSRFSLWLLDSWSFDRWDFSKRQFTSAKIGCLISEKSEDFN